jgi:hypothetical protein
MGGNLWSMLWQLGQTFDAFSTYGSLTMIKPTTRFPFATGAFRLAHAFRLTVLFICAV